MVSQYLVDLTHEPQFRIWFEFGFIFLGKFKSAKLNFFNICDYFCETINSISKVVYCFGVGINGRYCFSISCTKFRTRTSFTNWNEFIEINF